MTVERTSQYYADKSMTPFEQQVWTSTYAETMAILLKIEGRLVGDFSDNEFAERTLACAKHAATTADAAVNCLRQHVKATGALHVELGMT
jgi:hypothetical protein